MIPVSLRFRTSFLVAFLGSALLAPAGDVIKKKSGDTLDGKIVKETATEVHIEVVRNGINDTVKVPRTEILQLIKATPDLLESTRLKTLSPSEDGMSDAAYNKVLTDDLLPFVKKYPASPYKEDVEKIIQTYKEEMAKAKAGSKKIEGQWVTSQELDWNAYNIEARLRRVQFDQLLKKKDFLPAYQILHELEETKSASVETIKALESFKNAIPAYNDQLDLAILQQPVILKQTDESLKSLTAEKRKDVEIAKKQQAEDFKARLDEAKSQHLVITPIDALDLKSIQDAKAGLQKETDRISKLNLAALKVSAESFQTGLKNLYEKSYLSARRNFEEATKAFPKETFIRERMDVAKRAAEEEAKVRAETGSATVAPAVTPSADDSKKEAPAKTAAGAPTTPKPAAAAGSEEDDSQMKTEEPDSSMSIYLLAGAAALLVIGLIVKSLGKKKSRDGDD